MSNKIKVFYEFENFRLDAASASLWRADKLVAIPPKALETLILLVKNNGEIVSREELLATVWKDTFVEEGNINYTISLLRKTLENKDLIQTVPRRGYRFVAEVRETGAESEVVPNVEAPIIASDAAPTAAPEPKNKSRALFVAASLAGILVVAFFTFAWRSNPPVAKLMEGDPASLDESMQAYRRGRMILDDNDTANRPEKAIDEFQKAVTLAPTSALAHAGLAEGLMAKAHASPDEKSMEYYAKAKIAVEKAFTLDPNLFEAFLVRGWLKRNSEWDWSGAESDLRRAIELSPDSALAHFRYAQLLANIGRHLEARSEIETADRLDPLSEVIRSGHFPLLEAAGEYDKALALAEEVFQNNRENPNARRALATFLYHKGEYAKVIEHGEIALGKSESKRTFAWLSLLAASYLKTGQPEKSDELLKELEVQSHTNKKSLYSLAMNYAELGRTDEAVAAIEKCLEVREQRMLWVAVEPRFANLKNDPRFRQILVKMRLN